MILPKLLHVLTAAGVRLNVVAGRIRWVAPAGVITADLLAELKAHKPELVVAIDDARTWRDRVEALLGTVDPDLREHLLFQFDECYVNAVGGGLDAETAGDLAASLVRVPREVVA